MDDYISRQWLLTEYDKRHKGPPGGARKMIEEAPPADVRPVVYGVWMPIIDGNEYGEAIQIGCYCSQCGYQLQSEPYYCPNCGAKMGGADG